MNEKEARYFGGKKLYIVPRICRPKCCGHNITSMKKLSKETIQLISSTQVITSVYSAVKELVENSIDAGSTNIEVRLENFGLGRIEVLDNGCGIAVGEEEFVAKPHYTSKLIDDIGLRTLSTLGFRGEALHSLATVSSLSFSTKTENQQIGKMFFLDSDGSIIKIRPCSRETGVNMIAENLFKNLPVRKQFYRCVKKNKEELKKIEHLLISYGLIRPELRVVLKHNKSIIWQKSKHQTTKDSFISVFGTACFGQMKEGTIEDKSGNITIRFLLPRKDCVETLFRASNDRVFVFVNERPVEIKAISQVIKATYLEFIAAVSNRYPTVFMAITVPYENVDVNMEPNKSLVLLENLEEVIEIIKKTIRSMFEDCKPVTNVNDRENNNCSAGDCVAAKGQRDGTIKRTQEIDESGRHSPPFSPEISDPLIENYFPTTPEIPNSEKNSFELSNDFPADVLQIGNLNGNPLPMRECERSDELRDNKDDRQKTKEVEANKMCDKNIRSVVKEIIMPSHNQDTNTNSNVQSNCNDIDTSLSLFSELSDTLGNHSDDSMTVCKQSIPLFGSRETSREEEVSRKKLTGNSHALQKEVSPGSDLDEFFSVDEDECIFDDEPLVNSSQASRLKQISLDSWSRGTGINDRKNGAPVEPFIILHPHKKAPKKIPGPKMSISVQSKMNLGQSKSASMRNVSRAEDYNLSFKLHDIRKHFEEDELPDSEDCANHEKSKKIDVIGKFSPWNSWVICQNGKMFFFNPFRAREDLVYRELLRKYVLPTTSCTMPLDQRLKNFEKLQSLRFESIPPDTGRYLVDRRITANGFHIRQRKSASTDETIYEIVKVTPVIQDFGISELDEILDKISCGPDEEQNSFSLEYYRPLKIVEYLKAESFRIAQSTTNSFTSEDIRELANEVSFNNIIDEEMRCLHGKPFIYQFHQK